uniref:RNA-directed RNA polymerase n=1 Tax=Diaporthe helianthi totivirus 2 TaxID=3077437 RepID=A0AA96K9D1_9VIRU|nr:MAG: RNA-dependent RNA polymerase [Diaporthe helianthi totivirus 2]
MTIGKRYTANDNGMTFWAVESDDTATTNYKDFRYRKNKVPLAVSYKEHRTIYAENFSSSTHVFLQSRETSLSGVFEFTECAFGVSVSALMIADGALASVYYKVDQVYCSKIQEPMTIATRHFSGLYSSINFVRPCEHYELFRDQYPDRVIKGRIPLSEYDLLPVSKVTAQHHLHFVPHEVVQTMTADEVSECEDNVRMPTNATKTMAAGVLLWFVSLTDELKAGVISSGLFKCKTTAEFAKLGKRISVEAKSLQNMIDIDLRTVFEIDVLINRVEGAVDWDQEKQNRQTPVMTSFTSDEIYLASRQIFSDAKASGRRPMSMDWNKFWDSRWQWSAAGSTHSQYQEDMAYVLKDDIRLKNKFITISNMPRFPMTRFTNRPQEIQAWASTKYEWGKQRAIYGTDLTSYILSHFAMYNCEEVLPRQFPVGPDANDANVLNRVSAVLKGRLPFCLDFEDFNSQHRPEHMSAVIDAYGDEFKGILTNDQIEALRWTARSVEHQIINDNVGTRTKYEAGGTLLSGWRLTTFVNSVLNFVYTSKIAKEWRTPGSSLHNGDDVLIGTNNLACAQACQANASKFGVRLQSSKCAFGAIAEFLRVDHRRGSKGQYLTRAVATTMHSRIESRMSTDARDLVDSMETRFSDLLSRGMPLSRIRDLRELYYERQSKLCDTSVEDLYRMKLTHRVAGGISQAHDAGVKWLITPGYVRAPSVDMPKLPAVQDYALLVKASLQIEVPIPKIVKGINRATFEAVVEKSRKMKVSENNDVWYANVKRIYKAHSGTISVANYGKAALVGITLDILRASPEATALTHILNQSPRPMELLRQLV